ncbi:MAG: exonuclease SbcCD subunit D [Lachnospiraceae bacterium]|nr:exonuclease SbcCD subunit D [Lachnospiraceae bacterium]
MKFIHMADLHLGKRVNEFSMIEDQKYMLKEMITRIREERPDGVFVAGDVFDRGVAPEDAVKLWDDFLIALAKEEIPVYAISGNHDSAVRFADHGSLVEEAGIHLSPAYNGEVKSYTVEDAHGPLHIYLLPFIKPAIVRPFYPDEEIKDYTDACRVAIEQMHVNTEERNVLIAHQFVTGAKTCESEEIVVGGLDNVDATVFDPFDYVALGHIHGAQSVGRETIRYSGTPLKYSFSEKDHKKSLTVIEMEEKGNVKIREIPLVPMHDLREIRGTYEELMAKEYYEGTKTDDYIFVTLTDAEDVIDGMAKLRVVYKNIMKLKYDNERTRKQQVVTDAEDVEKKSPLELFGEFYEKQNNTEMSEEQRTFVIGLINEIWEG